MTGDVSNLGRQRYLLLISVILVLNMVGCVTGTPSTEPVDVDFVVKVEGKKVPDISRCEMFFWERPRMTGDVPDSHADECIGFSYVGYGCDVLWGAVEATGGRAGVMTHFMIDPKYGREARKYGLYNCTPDNYLEIASNAVVTAGVGRVKGRGSLSGSEAAFWPNMFGVHKDWDADVFKAKMEFVVRSWAKYNTFPELPTIRIAPEYSFGTRFVPCHGFFFSIGSLMVGASMRFQGYDGECFAEIRHGHPLGVRGMRAARRELVRFMLSKIGEARKDSLKIRGRIKCGPGDEDCQIVVDKCERRAD